MKSKSLLALLLALTLCLGLAACGGNGGGSDGQESENPNENNQTQEPEDAQEPEAAFPTEPIGTELGSGIADLTFTDYNGVTHTLYETLKEKKMVLINVWATWCGPCRSEFPYMEMAYEMYQDDIEIFALSCEAEDTDEIIAEFAGDLGLTFPMGQDTPGLGSVYAQGGIPTSLIVDRFGNICFLETGSITSLDPFCTLFELFTAEDYAESVVLTDGVPRIVPDVEAADPADLANLLGGNVTCSNPEDEYNWPMIIEGDHIVSTNAGVGNSTSALNVEVTASAGDVFAVDYLASTESGYDFMIIYVDGEMVKGFSGERDWSTFGYKFDSDGTYTVTLAYEKDEAYDDGDDAVSFRNVRVLSGSEAEAILASMPSYPYADEASLTVATPGAREVVFSDPYGDFEAYFGTSKWYIIPGGSATFAATLTEGMDPECTNFYTCYDGDFPLLSDCVAGDHYEFTSGIDTFEETGYTYSYVDLYPYGGRALFEIFFVSDEASLNDLLAENFTQEDGTLSVTWKYADGSAPETTEVCDGSGVLTEGNSLYYLVFVDQNGDPVEGVLANICDDTACTPIKSDANGIVAFSYPAFEYHIQVIKVPEGYEYDLSAETYVSADGGVTEFVVTKN